METILNNNLPEKYIIAGKVHETIDSLPLWLSCMVYNEYGSIKHSDELIFLLEMLKMDDSQSKLIIDLVNLITYLEVNNDNF